MALDQLAYPGPRIVGGRTEGENADLSRLSFPGVLVVAWPSGQLNRLALERGGKAGPH